MFSKCKVTVVKRSFDRELVEDHLNNPENFTICEIVKDNQEFIISSPFEMPENMCAYAWADIRPFILSIASGGTFGFMKDKNSALAMCTDPLRPVVFKITRID
jgi:uncharacterized repeat protein (TIGR04076 family)